MKRVLLRTEREDGGMVLIVIRDSLALVTRLMIVRLLWWLCVCVTRADSLRGGSYSVAGRESIYSVPLSGRSIYL